MALATSLGKLVKQAGGPNHAHVLLPPLELLLTVGKLENFFHHMYGGNRGKTGVLFFCEFGSFISHFPLSFLSSCFPLQQFIEENTVRDAASSSAQAISETLPDSSFQNQYAAMLSRLATKEWFTARMSSASLIASAYPKLTSQQQTEHLTLFAALCQDDTPMVRRVAAQYLGKMLENVVGALGRPALDELGVVTTLLIPLYEELASNEQPVRNFSLCRSSYVLCCGFKLTLLLFF